MTLKIDAAELEPWRSGLQRLVLDAVECSVTVAGLDEPITGTLASHNANGGMLLVSHDTDGQTGEVVWIPADRVVAIRAAFEVRDDPAD